MHDNSHLSLTERRQARELKAQLEGIARLDRSRRCHDCGQDVPAEHLAEHAKTCPVRSRWK